MTQSTRKFSLLLIGTAVAALATWVLYHVTIAAITLTGATAERADILRPQIMIGAFFVVLVAANIFMGIAQAKKRATKAARNSKTSA